MQISMYTASVPVFRHSLVALARVLGKAAAQTQTDSLDPAHLLQGRLHPTMFPLTRQVQIAVDFARGGAARLAGIDPPIDADDEKTFADLLARIDRALHFLDSVRPEQIDGEEARLIELKVGGKPASFEGLPYLLDFVLPNFYFHMTTAYAILRHHGIELGKRDFLGRA